MNINDVTVTWQDISDTERTALLNKPCPPRPKPKVLPPRKTPDRITSRVFSICQSAILNNHTVQRPVRLNNLKSHAAFTSSKENIDNAYRTMIEFTETCKRESHSDSHPTETPVAKRIRSSSPTTSTTGQCSSPSAISRYVSHDSYLASASAANLSSIDSCPVNTSRPFIEADVSDDALWEDWDLSSSAATNSTLMKKTPGKIRTMSSPAVHSRTKQIQETTTIVEMNPSTTIIEDESILADKSLSQLKSEEPKESTPMASKIVWDDDDDFEQLLTQFPVDFPSEQLSFDQKSPLQSISTVDNDATRLDATRRSSAMLNNENQSFVNNTTKIELSSQPSLDNGRISNGTTLLRSNTGPLSPAVTRTKLSQLQSPRNRAESASELKKKPQCTEAEIEQKRLAALAIRRRREAEEQERLQKRAR